jgi:putative tryptophan/tyrosine transport system substrate-binding protein
MQRRKFIALLGGAAAAWPLAARAQQAMPVIGFLRTSPLAPTSPLLSAFREGLKEQGFAEGHNVVIELRSADNHPDRVPALVAELVQRPVAVIVANSTAGDAAKAATTTVPIIFTLRSDPVAAGLVASLNRPGGNVTGVVFFSATLGAKRLELLHQVVPKATTIGLLVNPENIDLEADRKSVQSAAQTLGLRLIVHEIHSERDLEPAFAAIDKGGAGALLVGGGPFMFSNRERLVALAARRAMPASYALREYAEAGGLMSYGNSITDAYRQAGVYAGRILKGEKPAELPVMQSSKFEFVINLRTAKSLGLEVPPTLLAITDEAIE